MAHADFVLPEFVSSEDKTRRVYTLPYGDFEVPACYTLTRVLELAGRGIVCAATDSRDGSHVAIRQLHRGGASVQEMRAALRRLRTEHRLGGRCSILGAVDAWCALQPTGHDRHMNEIYAVTPLHGMPLRALLHQKASLELDAVRRIGRHIMRALRYAHSCGISHEQLTPGRVFVDPEAGHTARVTGFGFVQLTDPGLVDCFAFDGRYIAPEVVLHSGRNHCSRRADVWSAGCILYELLTHHALLDGCGSLPAVLHRCQQLLGAEESGDAPAEPTPALRAALLRVSDEAARDALLRMLQHPPRRATAAALLQHPFFADDEAAPEPRDMAAELAELEAVDETKGLVVAAMEEAALLAK